MSGHSWRSSKTDTVPCCQVWVMQVAAGIRLLAVFELMLLLITACTQAVLWIGNTRNTWNEWACVERQKWTSTWRQKHMKAAATEQALCPATQFVIASWQPVLHLHSLVAIPGASFGWDLWNSSMVKFICASVMIPHYVPFMVPLRTQQITGRASECRIASR